ncbi:MAG: hypothetical protein GWN17_05495 [Candidatus Korarchaeota archaeon]|nr:hypothetical protein [Candidatus Thorarchaeota archaeon]NIW51670.1 hypothetical protein [Candidatus Korarchaeota archaeon]
MAKLGGYRNRREILNKSLIINKVSQLERFAQRNVEVPDSIKYENVGVRSDYGNEIERGMWVVKPVNSQGGFLVRVWDGSRIRHNEYLQKRVVKFREFRAHVATFLPEEDRCFSIQEKKPKPELWDANISSQPETEGLAYNWPTSEDVRQFLPFTWNIANGFYYRRSTTPENRARKCRRTPLFGRIEDLGVRAIEALGYDFGAVDIVMDTDRNLYVLEVNSHPALKNDRSKEIYVTVFSQLESTRPQTQVRERETSYHTRIFTRRQ